MFTSLRALPCLACLTQHYSTTLSLLFVLAVVPSVMAILHDVEVTISAKGNKLPEYDDDAEEPGSSNMVTKYVEAVTGADFKIYYTIKPMFRLKSSGVSIDVMIDGEYMDSHVLLRNEELKHLSRVPWGGSFNGTMRTQNHSWTLQAFSFAEIKTSWFHQRQVVHLLTLSR